MTQDRYAYGCERVRGCECPAGHAGYEVADSVLSVAELYDTFARDADHSTDSGTLHASDAEECWRHAVSTMEDRAENHAEVGNEHAASAAEDAAEVGREILEEAF